VSVRARVRRARSGGPRPKRRALPTPDTHLWTGIAGILVAILLLGEFTVRVSLGPRPELGDGDALVQYITATSTGTLIVALSDTLMMAALLVFHAGLRQLIVEASPQLEWVATGVLSAGIVFVAVTLAGDSLMAGAALDTVGMAGDAVVIRALTDGLLMMFGPMSCAIISLMAGLSGYAIFSSGALPRWSGYLAWVVAVLNLVGIVTVFGGTDSRNPVSVGGWGATVFATFPWLVWVIGVSTAVFLERRHEQRPDAPPRAATTSRP
jgi:hypothetical protein